MLRYWGGDFGFCLPSKIDQRNPNPPGIQDRAAVVPEKGIDGISGPEVDPSPSDPQGGIEFEGAQEPVAVIMDFWNAGRCGQEFHFVVPGIWIVTGQIEIFILLVVIDLRP